MTQETRPQPAPTETLHIRNFAGMRDVTLELSRMNVLIGPSASGKSVCAKLLYFFKNCVRRLTFAIGQDLDVGRTAIEEGNTFLRYFPPNNWAEQDFVITYTLGDFQAEAKGGGRNSPGVAVNYSEPYYALRDTLMNEHDTLKKAYKTKNWEDETQQSQQRRNTAIAETLGTAFHNANFYIPAGRQFFSMLRANAFRIQEANLTLDPFVREFGQVYEPAYELCAEGQLMPSFVSEDDPEYWDTIYTAQILKGAFKRSGMRDVLVHSDGREVAVVDASSGQQEALPLIIMLRYLLYDGTEETMFIEEPEAHLYPTDQQAIVKLMARVSELFNSDNNTQLVVSTHSPYILSALNNLMYAGKIVRDTPDKKEKVTAIVPEQVLVDPAHVRAYMMEGGGAESIIGSESGLIVASEIDGVSNILGAEFNRLLDVEFDEEDEADEDAA